MLDDRFIRAHDYMYDRALEEIKKGKKMSHWIWYIFPQIAGLGNSMNSRYYALESIDEVKEYYQDQQLHDHLIEITKALLTHQGDNIEYIMGSRIDAIKLKSSMTLFYTVTQDKLFKDVLEIFFQGEKDLETLGILEKMN